MQIFRTRLYKTQLPKILRHIAKDKISASEKFYADLDKQINNLIFSPLNILKIFNKNKPKEDR
ncbi:MAG: hypothetical protein WC141_04030 [Arcobacteraceae bacterium]